MRDTVFCLVSADADKALIQKSVLEMIQKVQGYVPGYRLKQNIQFDEFFGRMDDESMERKNAERLKVSVFLEVEGAGHYLPSYAGNLDIMTSAALATSIKIVENMKGVEYV